MKSASIVTSIVIVSALAAFGCVSWYMKDGSTGSPSDSHPEGSPQITIDSESVDAVASDAASPEAVPNAGKGAPDVAEPTAARASEVVGKLPIPRAIAPFVEKAIEWLASAQHQNGGWGAGSHARQQVRDPHQVQTDPATTAFTAMALLRAGHTPVSGKHRETVRKATENLVAVVEDCREEGPKITDLTGTQPQSKLGQLVDTSMTAQFLARVLTTLPEGSDLRQRVDAALDKCLRKLQTSQQENGSWGSGGWAPVLQSSLGCSALELAWAAGKPVDGEILARARAYQKSNYDVSTGRASSKDGAGVELYSFASSQRGNANEARAASELIERAKKEGKLAPSAPVTVDNLVVAGVRADRAQVFERAFRQNDAQIQRLTDEKMLSGFGSNGGEEFLSYMLTSESLVIAGGEQWEKWNVSMHERLAKIQSPDGSWTGHHCITSPVFCTAAVVQCLTADRDAELLLKTSAHDIASSKK